MNVELNHNEAPHNAVEAAYFWNIVGGYASAVRDRRASDAADLRADLEGIAMHADCPQMRTVCASILAV